ncbi:MAG: TetR/AcrR family transcriptional regulator [Gordonia sp. (in: high G+C Gram-positive bacteria)]
MPPPRPLTAESIVDAAVRVADQGGLTAVSMRGVGKELGVEAMSLYHHVANKEALLDALADWIFAQIVLPKPDDDWRTGMVRRSTSSREVLSAHPWALTLIESRTNPGPALLRHHDAVVGCLRHDGFSLLDTSHAFSVLDAYVYGFVLVEQTLPFDPSTGGAANDFADDVAPMLAAYPNLRDLTTELIDDHYAYSDEFAHGLDLILDGIARRRGEKPQ